MRETSARFMAQRSFREFQLMKQGGANAMQILHAPRLMRRNFLAAKPARISARLKRLFRRSCHSEFESADEIKNSSDIDTVIKNGVLYQVDSILR